MAKKFKAPKRWTEKAINKLRYQDIIQLNRKEMIRLANAYQRQFRKRVRSFKGLYSYAEQSLRDSFKDKKVKSKYMTRDGTWSTKEFTIKSRFKLYSKINDKTVSTMRLDNDLRSYLAKMAHFFNPEGSDSGTLHTNTLAGIQAHHRQLEAYMFGTDERGNPLANVSQAEMKNLLKLYNEYYHSHSGEDTWQYQAVFTSIAYLYQSGELRGENGPDWYTKLTNVMDAYLDDRVDLYEVDNFAPNEQRLGNIRELVRRALRAGLDVDSGISLEPDNMIEVVGRNGDNYPL